MSRIGCVLITPKQVGGAETALRFTAEGLRDLGHDVDVIALSRTEGIEWAAQSREFVTRTINTKVEEIENVLGEYDGLVLSDTYFGNDLLSKILAESDKIAPWTSGRHWNSIGKSAQARHEICLNAPKWSRTYVSFWHSAEAAHTDVKWERGILPYKLNKNLHGLPSLSKRPFDFGFVGRTGQVKGITTFTSALEGVTRLGGPPFKALIAGAPEQLPGGPYIFAVGNKLEEWGWTVARDNERMDSRWLATHPNGSTVRHLGAYTQDQLPKILGAVKCYINCTSGKASPNHAEYATLEALDAGCFVIAANDWSDYHYNNTPPKVKPLPLSAYKVKKPGTDRIVYNDHLPEAPVTTYKELAELFIAAKGFFEKPVTDVDGTMSEIVKYNRNILMNCHDPLRAGQAFVNALGLK